MAGSFMVQANARRLPGKVYKLWERVLYGIQSKRVCK